MAAKPLTKAEKAWLAKLEQVMMECPSDRLCCYTIGDRDLHFYDHHVSRQWEKDNPREELDASILHERAGSALATVNANFKIDNCAG
jgi:hypothetical protein